MHPLWIGIAGALLLTPGTTAAQEKSEWACPPFVLNPACADQALGPPIHVGPPRATSGSSAASGERRESRDIGAPDAVRDAGRSGDREPPAFTPGGDDAGRGTGTAKD